MKVTVKPIIVDAPENNPQESGKDTWRTGGSRKN